MTRMVHTKYSRENKIDVTFISWNSQNTSNLKIRYVIIHTFMYHVDYDTSVGGLFVPDGIIRPEVSAEKSVLRHWLGWLDIFFYWNLQFLNNVIINKTKVLLLQSRVTLADFGFIVSKFFNYFAFQIFRFWAFLIKGVPERRRAHLWYLRFYWWRWTVIQPQFHINVWSYSLTLIVCLVQCQIWNYTFRFLVSSCH